MYVYVLKSKYNDRIYIGSTEDVNARLKQHNRGDNKSTQGYRPWILLRAEAYQGKTIALKLERFLKSGRGREVLKNLCSLCND